MNTSPPLWIVDDPRFDQHRPGRPHPERPQRRAAARRGLLSAVGAARPEVIEAPRAPDDLLERVHTPGYLQILRRTRGHSGHLDPDTYVAPASEDAAWRAAGAAATLAERLMSVDAGVGIALVRPPGHHARPSTAMGFCLLNNVAVGAVAGLRAGAERVAIVDWDVHHGNGTQEIFEDDPRVLFVSLHQAPHYPGTGAVTEVGRGAGRGTTINVPFPAHTGPAAYGEAFRRVVLPAVLRFAPDLLLVSAGFDAHARDPLGEIELDDACFGAMAGALAAVCPRIALALEGGYDLEALEGSWRAVGRALVGQAPALPEDRPRPAARAVIDRVVELHRATGALPSEG